MDALDLLVQLLMRFEGFRARPYYCSAGVLTIGYGETAGVKLGMVWTREQAEAVLRRRAAQFLLLTLKRCPQLHLEPPERQAACASLAYNIGSGAFAASSVCRKTKRLDYAGAADSFLLWSKAGGRVVAGLTKRRLAERSIYFSAQFSANETLMGERPIAYERA